MERAMALTFYNDTRKFCPACHKQRSIRQFSSREDRYCAQCVRRGDDKKPESTRTEGRSYTINRSE